MRAFLMEGTMPPEAELNQTTTITAPLQQSQLPETFSREYVHELREEAKNTRIAKLAVEVERDTFKTVAEKAKQEADERVTNSEKTSNDRIMRSELKAVALKAGMIDLDGLKLADLTKVTLEADGTIKGADEMLEQLKKDKPYLFGQQQSSSTTTAAPSPKPTTVKLAKDMTTEEYNAARKAIR